MLIGLEEHYTCTMLNIYMRNKIRLLTLYPPNNAEAYIVNDYYYLSCFDSPTGNTVHSLELMCFPENALQYNTLSCVYPRDWNNWLIMPSANYGKVPYTPAMHIFA
jgi:hypothetical protein